VAALPYDVFSRKEAAAEIAAHPHSFLRIDKSAALFADEVDEYDGRVYEKAAELFEADLQAGVYLRDDAPSYFCYRLEKAAHAQVGIVACIAAKDYLDGTLRRHENTRAFKLEDRIRHISALGAQTGPVLVTYRPQESIDAAVRQVMGKAPLYDFVAPDAIRHTIWRVDDPVCARAIREGFEELDALYIADGHHRAAAAVEVARASAAAPSAAQPAAPSAAQPAAPTATPPSQAPTTPAAAQPAAPSAAQPPCPAATDAHFLIAAFPSDQLAILDYNRVVFDTNGLSDEALLARIAERFELRPHGEKPFRPQHRGQFGVCLDGRWYCLEAPEALRPDDPVDGLDVSLLQEGLLAPILGIDDPRSSRRIAYVGGARGLEELARRAGPGTGAVAFALFPCSLDELFAVADAGRLMPPKSTWFEPKPRSGLFVHELERPGAQAADIPAREDA
jgi:uncharacterized protein (DUF1015 family)